MKENTKMPLPDKKNLHTLFNPKSVAVVGASNNPGKWGCSIIRNCISGGFAGKIYPVNSSERTILGLKSYPEVTDLPESPELIFCVIPSQFVPELMKKSAQIGCHNMVIVTSNFSESGDKGAALEKDIIDIANENAINFVGPNTMGIISHPAKLYAIWAFDFGPPGGVSIIAQSGNLGLQLINWGCREGIGVARFVGSGNEAYLKTEDYLEYFGDDEATRVIAMYLEGINDGRRFLETAQRVTQKKPVIVLKKGNTTAGQAAARSHTGSISGDKDICEAAFKQAGLIMAENTQDLMDYAKGFSNLPLPQSKKVAIVTLGGGWGVISADASANEGLEVGELTEDCLKAVDEELPEYWSRQNPVDMVGIYNRSSSLAVLEAVLSDPGVNSVIHLGLVMGRTFKDSIKAIIGSSFRIKVLIGRKWRLPFFILDTVSGFLQNMGFSPKIIFKKLFSSKRSESQSNTNNKKGKGGLFTLSEFHLMNDMNFAAEIKKLQDKHNKPVVTIPFYEDLIPAFNNDLNLVAFNVPERGVRVLARAAEYNEFLLEMKQERDVKEEWSKMEVDVNSTISILKSASNNDSQENDGALSEGESKKLLQTYGIPVTPEEIASSEEHSLEIADKIGYPVVLKIDSPDILHKTEMGVVEVGINDRKQLIEAYRRIMNNLNGHNVEFRINGMMIQKMIENGHEFILGMSQDDQFGPVLVFGLGGIYVETMRQVAHHLIPLSLKQSNQIIRESVNSKILSGFRGLPPVNIDALAETIWRFSRLAYDFQETIQEMEINPLMVQGHDTNPENRGITAADALVVLGKSTKNSTL